MGFAQQLRCFQMDKRLRRNALTRSAASLQSEDEILRTKGGQGLFRVGWLEYSYGILRNFLKFLN